MFKHIQLTSDVCGHSQPKMKQCIVQVGVIQFSNDVHVQIPLETQDKDSFEKAMADMVRSHMQSSPPCRLLWHNVHWQNDCLLCEPA